MIITDIVFIVFILIAAAVLAWWLYFQSKKRALKPLDYLFFGLRLLSIAAILSLLLNPSWVSKSFNTEKPALFVAVDNSTSMKSLKVTDEIVDVVQKIQDDAKLKEAFEISYFTFGENTNMLDSLSFDESQTNYETLLHQLGVLGHGQKQLALVLTDGNQTLGSNPVFLHSNMEVIPVIFGDTLSYDDLSILRVNVNPYTYLNNNFPVEIYTLYKGNKNIDYQLDIYKNNKRVLQKKLTASKENNSQHLNLKLPADEVGQQYYKIVLSSLQNEKNTRNNRADFSIEVLDEQTEILIVSPFSHPDIGAIKQSLESQKKYKISTKIGWKNKIDFTKYNLVVLYQPNPNISSYIDEIENLDLNTFIITGTKTDWNYVNSFQKYFQKRATTQTENYRAVYNKNYDEFVTNDIDVYSLPPLQDKFGSISFKVPAQTLFYQKVAQIDTGEALLATFTDGDRRFVTLFGEGIWKWRMQSKIENNTFEVFDALLSTIVQFSASKKSQDKLFLDYKKLFFNNTKPEIHARLLDKNMTLRTDAQLQVSLTNKQTKENRQIPFYIDGNTYQVTLPVLVPGDYSFSVNSSGLDITKSGSFRVLDYQVEEQFTTANIDYLKKWAVAQQSEVLNKENILKTINELTQKPAYKPVQKSTKKQRFLIDWHWLLALIILSLSAEWFLRKYHGLL